MKTSNYNPKIDYLFCKYSYSKFVSSEDELTCRNVFYKENKPTTETEAFMLKMKKALLKIKASDLNINTNNVIDIYSIFDENVKVNSTSLIEMVEEYKKYNDYEGMQLFAYVIENNVFSCYNTEMAKLLYTWHRLSKNYVPIIFYPVLTEELLKYINSDYDIGFLNGLLGPLVNRSSAINIRHQIYSREYIANKLLSIKEELKLYGVISLSLYGSFSRDEATEYSDVDLFVKTSFSVTEDEDSAYKLRTFLKKKLPVSVDITFNEFKKCFSVEPIRNLYMIF